MAGLQRSSRAAAVALVLIASVLLLVRGGTSGADDRREGSRVRTMTKVSADLAQLHAEHVSRTDLVPIDAVASGDVDVLKADLEALGLRDTVAFGRIVSGRLPIGAISALEGLASLQFARLASATTHPGAPREGVR
jgi:hypothetical protein